MRPRATPQPSFFLAAPSAFDHKHPSARALHCAGSKRWAPRRSSNARGSVPNRAPHGPGTETACTSRLSVIVAEITLPELKNLRNQPFVAGVVDTVTLTVGLV